MNNDTYILMGGRGVKNNPYQTLNALLLYEKNRKLEKTLQNIKNSINGYCDACKEHEPNKKCQYCNYEQIKRKINEVVK